MKTYTADQIEQLSILNVDENGVALAVKPMLETAFFLAGATISTEDSRQQITLVRCQVGKTCDVDVPAMLKPGTPEPATIVIPDRDKAIDIVFSDGQKTTLYEVDQ